MAIKTGKTGCSTRRKLSNMSKPRMHSTRNTRLPVILTEKIDSYDAGIQTFDTANVSTISPQIDLINILRDRCIPMVILK